MMTISYFPVRWVTAFIDGLNICHGLVDAGFHRLLWFDYRDLVEQFLRPGQSLEQIWYRTTKITQSVENQTRQLARSHNLTRPSDSVVCCS